MSLLTSQTSNLLGIGEGSVQDFAAGITTRRKQSKGLSREEALQNATASEGQDKRLIDAGDLKPQHDPKKTQGARLKLTTNDRDFIQNLRYIERKIFKGENELGKNATERLKGEVKGLLTAASKSSRGGLEDVWGEVYERIANQHGRTAPGGLGKLQDAWGRAMEQTNKVLDTSVDVKTYKFETPGQVTGVVKAGQERNVAKRSKAAGGRADVTNFWENPEYIQALSIGTEVGKHKRGKARAPKKNPLTIF